MKSSYWRTFVLLSLTLVLMSTAMDAQAARRSSFAGNQFIDDPDDMFAFPQLTMKYTNRIIIDMAPNGNSGNGSIIFGDNTVWNFNTGRGDFLNNTAQWAAGSADRFMGIFDANGTPGSNGSNGSSIEWWDIGMATHLGDTPFGFNLSWATDKNKFKPDGADPVVDNSSSMISLQVGVTLSDIEIAAEAGFGSYEDDVATLDPSDQNDFSFSNFSLLARGNIDDFGGQNWRWVAAFATGKNSPDLTDAVDLSTTGFRGSFGPVWGTPGEWEVAAYMSFNYLSHETQGGLVDLKNTQNFTSFPAYNMATEYYLNDWFVIRGGIASQNVSDTFEQGVDGSDNKSNDSDNRFTSFLWTAGLGIDKGNWGLDMALDESDVHSGYLPLNGDVSNDPIAYMTAWMTF